jgi:membrane protein DedA with SNARE-associated domain
VEFYLAQAAAEPVGGLAGWAVGVVDSLGGPGIGILVALDNIFPLIPSDLILPLVGFTATQGALGLGAAIAWSTAGSVLGALVMYTVGMLLGRERARAVLLRIPGFTARTFDRAEGWFDRHGSKAVLFGRLVPMFRSLISLPAGVERMLLPKFVLLTAIGCLVWNSALLVAGYLLGANWQVASDFANALQFVVFVAVPVVIVLFVVKRIRAKRAGSVLESSPADVDRDQDEVAA